MLYLFTVTVAEGYSAEQYAEAWVRASRLIQAAPGARGTRPCKTVAGTPRPSPRKGPNLPPN